MKVLVIGVAMLAGGCGSGFEIRQVDPPKKVAEANKANASQVAVVVEKAREDGEGNSYSPKIEITNLSGSSIFVSRVELEVGDVIYPDSNPKPRAFPFAIQPGKSESLTAVFQLREDANTAFRKSSKIAVYYRGENVEQVYRVGVARRVL